MGFLKPINVYEESWFVLFVTKLFGLFPLECCCKMAAIGYTYVLLLLITYYILFFAVHEYAFRVFETFDIMTDATKIRKIRYYMNLIMLPVMMLSNMNRCTDVKKVYQSIDDVDKSFKFLNSNVDHIWCMKKDIVYVTSTILVVLLFNLMEYYTLVDESSNYMLTIMWIVDRTPDFLNNMIMCSFVSLINKIRLRFKEVNRIMDATLQEKYSATVSVLSNADHDYRWKLLKSLHLKLCKTLSIVNAAYSLQFTILSMVYIMYICLHFTVIYYKSFIPRHSVDVIISALACSLDLAKVVYMIRLYSIFTIQHT